MKKLLILSSLLLLIAQLSCKNMKKQDDVYFYLTEEQKIFINAAKTGDTAIWETDTGVKDTGIVQPVVYDTYVIEQPRNGGKTIGERAYYLYHFVGTKKTKMVADGIGVIAGSNSLNYILVSVSKANGSIIKTAETKGNLATKKLNTIDYTNVYYCAFLSSDTLYFNNKGYLGHKYNGENSYKIK